MNKSIKKSVKDMMRRNISFYLYLLFFFFLLKNHHYLQRCNYKIILHGYLSLLSKKLVLVIESNRTSLKFMCIYSELTTFLYSYLCLLLLGLKYLLCVDLYIRYIESLPQLKRTLNYLPKWQKIGSHLPKIRILDSKKY